MTARPLRRWLGATAAGLTLLLSAAAPGPVQAQADDPPALAEVALVDRTPWVTPGQVLVLDVAVAFAPGAPAEVVEGATAQVEVHRALRDAEELEASTTEDVGVILSRVELGPVADLPVPAPDTRRLEVPTMPEEPGVYSVVVEIVAPDGAVITTARTPVVQVGPEDDPIPAPDLSLVVDVAVAPTIEPEGRRELTEVELDRLDRLAGLLESDLDLSVVAVPDTLDAVAASPDSRAVRLASVLAEERSGRTALAQPYVVVSPVSLEASLLVSELVDLVRRGDAVLTDRLGFAIDATVWDGADVGTTTAALLRDRGVRHYLRAPVRGPEADGQLVDAGPAPVPGLDASVLTVDAETSDRLLEPTAGGVDDGHLALADLVLRDDGRASDVVIRVDDAPEDAALLALLPLLSRPDSPVTVGALTVGPPDGDPVDVDLTVPEPTLPAEDYRRAEAAVAAFASLAGPDSARAAELDLELSTSLAAPLDDDDRRALLGDVESSVDGVLDGVRLAGQTDLNLTSRRGSLPVTVVNDNPFPVEVRLRLRSDRLRFPDGEEISTEVGAEPSRLDVPVEALATGSVPTFVELWTPDGTTLLDTRQLNVRSTAISGVGLAISLGALTVLVVWWVRTWRRNRRSPGVETAN